MRFPAIFIIVPDPRTLRKAREQVRWMVPDEVSLPKIGGQEYQQLGHMKNLFSGFSARVGATIAEDLLRNNVTELDYRAMMGDSIRPA